MSTIKEIALSATNTTLHIHQFPDLCDSVTGRVLTGSWMWDSAVILSNFISESEFSLHGKTVVELGAGTGLPGLTAAMLGARRVILTDVASILPGLRKNVEVNELVDRVQVCELVWGSDELVSQLGELEVADLVLMSDVFYDKEEMAGLAKTLVGVCGAETTVWAASELRESTGECLDELVSYGFEVSQMASRTRLCDGSELFAVYRLVPPVKMKELKNDSI